MNADFDLCSKQKISSTGNQVMRLASLPDLRLSKVRLIKPNGSFIINDVTASGGEGVKDFVTIVLKYWCLKRGRWGRGCQKIVLNCAT